MFELLAFQGGIYILVAVITAILYPIGYIIVQAISELFKWDVKRNKERNEKRVRAMYNLYAAGLIADPRPGDHIGDAKKEVIKVFGSAEKARKWRDKYITEDVLKHWNFQAERDSYSLCQYLFKEHGSDYRAPEYSRYSEYRYTNNYFKDWEGVNLLDEL